jgi:hypothetical protein
MRELRKGRVRGCASLGSPCEADDQRET